MDSMKIVLAILCILLFARAQPRIANYLETRLARLPTLSRGERRPGTSPAWLWVFLIAVVVLITTYLNRKPKAAGPAAEAVPNTIWPPTTSQVLYVSALMICVGWVAWVVRRNRPVMQATTRANAGDIDGAIEDLRGAIAAKGETVNLLNALGCLYYQKAAYDDALVAFQRAEAVGGRRPLILANEALILPRTGKPAEAAELFKEASSKAPRELTIACNYCLLLADLGRWEEAREQLRRAESLVKVHVSPAAVQRDREAAVQKCRDRVAGKSKGGELEGIDEP